MIIKRNGKYELRSFKTGKLLGVFNSREAAIIREKQIQYFKRINKKVH